MTTDLERDLEALAARLRASTVAVHSAAGRGSGSGVIWASDGTIVTNAHVAMSRTVEIELPDGRRLPGRVERRDERHDLAGIRIAATGLATLPVRNPGDLRTGEVLVAFGHPLGVSNVLTTGIAFGPHRSGADRFVRADVRLAPGNSGGALADSAGRIVGINSMVAGGLALAVPSDEVRRFLGEEIPARRLGVRLSPVTLGRGRTAYAVTATEPGSLAERAGIIPGDVILTRSVALLATATHVNLLRAGVVRSVPIERDRDGIAAAA